MLRVIVCGDRDASDVGDAGRIQNLGTRERILRGGLQFGARHIDPGHHARPSLPSALEPRRRVVAPRLKLYEVRLLLVLERHGAEGRLTLLLPFGDRRLGDGQLLERQLPIGL